MKRLIAIVIVSLLGLAALTAEIVISNGFPTVTYGWGPNTGGNVEIVGKDLVDGKLILKIRKTMTYFFPEGIQTGVQIWQEVYSCSNGVVALEKVVEGTYIPAHSEQEQTIWNYKPGMVPTNITVIATPLSK